jgi:hypothetical protein
MRIFQVSQREEKYHFLLVESESPLFQYTVKLKIRNKHIRHIFVVYKTIKRVDILLGKNFCFVNIQEFFRV